MPASGAARPLYGRRLFLTPTFGTPTCSAWSLAALPRRPSRAGFPRGNDVDRRAPPGRVRKHLSARPRPTRPVHPLSVPYRSPVWHWKSRRTLLSVALALCRRTGSPARSGVVAGVAAHAGRGRRADVDAAHRRPARLAGGTRKRATQRRYLQRSFTRPAMGVANVVHRRPLRRYEIPIVGRSGMSSDRLLRLEDLLVTVRDGAICLRSRRLGRRVVPRLTCAHNLTRGRHTAFVKMRDN